MEKDVIPICFACDVNYIPLTSVAIQSIIDKSSNKNIFDIHIFHSKIPTEIQNKIKGQFENNANVTITFDNVSKYFDNINLYTQYQDPSMKYTEETYYRLVIPTVLKQYNKVLYLDGDILVNSDIAELYETDIGDNLLAGAIDFYGIGECHSPWSDRKEYVTDDLKIDPDKLIIAGILLMNNKEFNKEFTTDYLIELSASKNWIHHDQDILNMICHNRIHIIDPTWGVMPVYKHYNTIPKNIGYRESYQRPIKLLHYGGSRKPWNDGYSLYAREYWRTASRTLFYDDLLSKVKQFDKKFLAVLSMDYRVDFQNDNLVIKNEQYTIGLVRDSPITIYKISSKDNTIRISGFLKAPWANIYQTKVFVNIDGECISPKQRTTKKNKFENPFNMTTIMFELDINSDKATICPYSTTCNVFISEHIIKTNNGIGNHLYLKNKKGYTTISISSTTIQIENNHEGMIKIYKIMIKKALSKINKTNIKNIPQYSKLILNSFKHAGIKKTIHKIVNKLK